MFLIIVKFLTDLQNYDSLRGFPIIFYYNYFLKFFSSSALKLGSITILFSDVVLQSFFAKISSLTSALNSSMASSLVIGELGKIPSIAMMSNLSQFHFLNPFSKGTLFT